MRRAAARRDFELRYVGARVAYVCAVSESSAMKKVFAGVLLALAVASVGASSGGTLCRWFR